MAFLAASTANVITQHAHDVADERRRISHMSSLISRHSFLSFLDGHRVVSACRRRRKMTTGQLRNVMTSRSLHAPFVPSHAEQDVTAHFALRGADAAAQRQPLPLAEARRAQQAPL